MVLVDDQGTGNALCLCRLISSQNLFLILGFQADFRTDTIALVMSRCVGSLLLCLEICVEIRMAALARKLTRGHIEVAAYNCVQAIRVFFEIRPRSVEQFVNLQFFVHLELPIKLGVGTISPHTYLNTSETVLQELFPSRHIPCHVFEFSIRVPFFLEVGMIALDQPPVNAKVYTPYPRSYI